jgi:tRNA (guanine-N7-)-methyltransferase
MTPGQQHALDTLWQCYGIEPGSLPLDLDALFGRTAPRILEIGFGMGDTLAETALAHPEQDYLGIEVHRPGVGHLLQLLAAHKLSNVRVLCADAVDVLQRHIPDHSLAAVHLFFPDPWPKRRHHKRRIVQAAFVARVANVLKPGGCFHLATDWEDYAQHMLQVMRLAPHFINTAGAGRFASGPGQRPLTKFERRGQRLGHPAWDLVFRTRAPDSLA